MQLTILGSGTNKASKTRSAPAYLLKVDGELILLDSGEGTKRRLAEAGIDNNRIRYLSYTHFHNDHINELPALLWSWSGKKRQLPLMIVGPRGMKSFFKEMVNLYMTEKKFLFEIKIIEMSNQKIVLDKFDIETRLISQIEPLTKYKNAVAYRINFRNKSIVYTGDVRPEAQDKITKLAEGSQVLVIDAARLDGEKDLDHLTPSLAGEIATKAKVKKLVLVHLYYPEKSRKVEKQARRAFKGQVILAKDLMKIEI